MQPSVAYLGHTVDAEGLHPTEENVRAIKDAPAARDVSELRFYLGLVQYYGCYIPNATDVYCLLKRGVTWKWSSTQQQAFQQSLLCLQALHKPATPCDDVILVVLTFGVQCTSCIASIQSLP